jgi:hypothetical protein
MPIQAKKPQPSELEKFAMSIVVAAEKHQFNIDNLSLVVGLVLNYCVDSLVTKDGLSFDESYGAVMDKVESAMGFSEDEDFISKELGAQDTNPEKDSQLEYLNSIPLENLGPKH